MIHLQIIRTRHPPEAYLVQLADLHEAIGFPVRVATLRRRLEELPREDRLLLAVEGDQLVGYAHLRVAHDLINDETAEVVAIAVQPHHRRRGVGRHLITAAETWARQSGRARLLLRTDVVRSEAHAFYVAMGYQQEATTLEFVRDLAGVRKADAPTTPPDIPSDK